MIPATIVEDADGNRGEVITNYNDEPGTVTVRFDNKLFVEAIDGLTVVG